MGSAEPEPPNRWSSTCARPHDQSLTPAKVDHVFVQLANAVALPQVARQLGDILTPTNDDHVLEMDKSDRDT